MFGSEPKDYNVYEFLLENWQKLAFSSPKKSEGIIVRKLNPKRMQREIQKELSSAGIGTKAQLALKAQQEEGKLAKKRNRSLKMKPRKNASLRSESKRRRKSIWADRMFENENGV